MNTTSWLPLALIGLPVLGGLLEFAIGRGGKSPATGIFAVISSGLAFALGLTVIPALLNGFRPAAPWGALVIDTLGLTLVLMTSVLGAIGLAFARRHLAAEVEAGRAKAGWLPMLFGCSALFVGFGNWAVLTDHLIMLYVAVEATTVATALPVAFYRRRTSWEAAYKYLLLNTVGLTVGLLGLVFLYVAALPHLGAQALSISALAAAGAQLSPRIAALAGALVIVGFGTKAALMPMHAWLPDAYQESPGGFSALFSGVGTKIAALAMLRVLPPLVAAAPALGTTLVTLAAVTMLVGIAIGFYQDDLRRMLGYSSVSQMGYILMAMGAGGAAGYGAAVYHMVSHGLIKALLFLCVAEVCQVAGTARISELSGKQHPRWVGPIFLLASVGLGGVPPMPAFWSKFQVFLATAQSGHPWAAGVAVLTSLLTITTLVWAGARVFLLEEHHGHDHGHDHGHKPAVAGPLPWLLVLMVVVVVAAGLVPGWMTAFLGQAVRMMTAMGV